MAGDRFVVLGLAAARAGWFRSVAVWATSGALPVEFVKCVSSEEVRARLASGRRFSALLADASLPCVDRDLVATAVGAGCAVLVVAAPHVRCDWEELGASRVLPAGFGRDELAAALSACSRVRRADADAELAGRRHGQAAGTGAVIAVTGPGGTGASTASMSLAQALATGAAGRVLLADLRLNAEQAMLHHVGDVGPGVEELVEAHRSGRPNADVVRSGTFDVADRGYHLLLGLRRARFWPALRPRAFEAAFESLRSAYAVTVCDTDPDLEGDGGGGSPDLEERNVMARTSMAAADAVVVVGGASVKGLHSLVRVVREVDAFGVDQRRIVPVLNRVPRSPRLRAELASTVAELLTVAVGSVTGGLVFVPDLDIDSAVLRGERLPAGPGVLLAGAVAAVLRRRGAAPAAVAADPPRVQPGTLGRWATA